MGLKSLGPSGVSACGARLNQKSDRRKPGLQTNCIGLILHGLGFSVLTKVLQSYKSSGLGFRVFGHRDQGGEQTVIDTLTVSTAAIITAASSSCTSVCIAMLVFSCCTDLSNCCFRKCREYGNEVRS